MAWWWHTALILVPRHYLAVPPGPHLSSMILNSPILASDRGILEELAPWFPAEFHAKATLNSNLAWT